MSRITYPISFLKQAILFDNIKAKHDADGANSPLTAFFLQQGIDIVADAAAVSDARQVNTQFEAIFNQSTDMTQDRNNFFDIVFVNYRLDAQYLKAFYKGNVRQLGAWGIPVDHAGQLNYPSDFRERTVLVKNLYAHHNSLGAASPLTVFLTENQIIAANEVTNTTKAEILNANMQQAKRDAEQYSQRRDNLFEPVLKNIHKIGDFLKKLYTSNAKKLGLWGIDVDNSQKEPRERTATLLPNTQQTIRGIKNHSQLENTGNIPLTLYRGTDTSTEAITLTVGEQFNIKHGWGFLTFVNTSTTESGMITYLSINGIH